MTPQERLDYLEARKALAMRQLEQARADCRRARRRLQRVVARAVALHLVAIVGCCWVASLGNRYGLTWWTDILAAAANAIMAVRAILLLPKEPIP